MSTRANGEICFIVKMTNEGQRKMSSSLEFYFLFGDGADEHDKQRSALHSGLVRLLCKWVKYIHILCFITLSMKSHTFEYFGK